MFISYQVDDIIYIEIIWPHIFIADKYCVCLELKFIFIVGLSTYIETNKKKVLLKSDIIINASSSDFFQFMQNNFSVVLTSRSIDIS